MTHAGDDEQMANWTRTWGQRIGDWPYILETTIHN